MISLERYAAALRPSADCGAPLPHRCSAACPSASLASPSCCSCKRSSGSFAQVAGPQRLLRRRSRRGRARARALDRPLRAATVLTGVRLLFPSALIALVAAVDASAAPLDTRSRRGRGRELSADHRLHSHLLQPTLAEEALARRGVLSRVGTDRAHLHRRPDAGRAVRRDGLAPPMAVWFAAACGLAGTAAFSALAGAARIGISSRARSAQPARSARRARFPGAGRRWCCASRAPSASWRSESSRTPREAAQPGACRCAPRAS